jgi:hypothetical protein
MKKILLIIMLSFFGASLLGAQGTCITTSNNGPYTVGIKVTYETLANGTDVKVTFQLLDLDKTVDVAYLWNPDPNFSETIMNKDANNTFSLTLTGQTGTISKACKMVLNGGGQIVTAYVNYEVNTDCSGMNDVTPPNNFTASVGATTAFSVEFLLNASDDSATVAYYITFGGITKAISTDSNVSKSFVISGLDPETDYNFSITASDLAGNTALNSPILLDGSTIIDTSTPCSGTSADDQPGQGGFEVGYNYSFETLPNGTDVKFTFELLDDKIGVVAYLWRTPPDFLETQMTLVSGQTFTLTVSGQTPGATITYASKFAFQGGQAVTKYFDYVVGEDCILGINDLELNKFKVFPNPAKDSWTVSAKNINILSIQIIDILGKNVMSLSPNASEIEINASALKAGVYFAQIKTVSGLTSLKLVKK